MLPDGDQCGLIFLTIMLSPEFYMSDKNKIIESSNHRIKNSLK